MCGRIAQYYTWRELHELYGLTGPALNIEPRYNIAPTTDIVAIRGATGKRIPSIMRWGLVPSWWKDDNPPTHAFNARSEGIAAKPMWRKIFNSQRCIVPVSGFYEWKNVDGTKKPYFVTLKDGAIMSLAGLWDRFERDGEEVFSCAVITTGANETMAPIHDRMPVILGPYDLNAWLSGLAEADILQPCPANRIVATEVSPYVNRIANHGPECIVPTRS